MRLKVVNGKSVSLFCATVLLFAFLITSMLGRTTYTGETLLLAINQPGAVNGTVSINSDLQFLNTLSLRNVKRHALGSNFNDTPDALSVRWLANPSQNYSAELEFKFAEYMAAQKQSSAEQELMNLQNPRGTLTELSNKNVLPLLIRFQSNDRGELDKLSDLSRKAVKSYYTQKFIRDIQKHIQLTHLEDHTLLQSYLGVEEHRVIAAWSKRLCFSWRDFPADVLTAILHHKMRVTSDIKTLNKIRKNLRFFRLIDESSLPLTEYLNKSLDVEFRLQNLINDIFLHRPNEAIVCKQNKSSELLADYLVASEALFVHQKKLFSERADRIGFETPSIYSTVEVELINFVSEYGFVELGQHVRQEVTSLLPTRDILLIVALWAITLLAYSRRWLVSRMSKFLYKRY